jgi:hypothetical protein
MVALLKTKQRPDGGDGMGLTDDQIQLLLAGLFVLDITRSTTNEDGEAIKVLASKLGGDPNATFFRSASSAKRKMINETVAEHPSEPLEIPTWIVRTRGRRTTGGPPGRSRSPRDDDGQVVEL